MEENILRKANQKRHLDDMVITNGSFTTDFFHRVDIRELLQESSSLPRSENLKQITEQEWVKALSQVEEDRDVLAMKEVQKEVINQEEEFKDEKVIKINFQQKLKTKILICFF